jgi:GNAT superfamily N-acetyltransferase
LQITRVIGRHAPCAASEAANSVDRMINGQVARTAVTWAEAEGWNPGLDDEERFLLADPDAFIAVEDAGGIAGTVSCALYGDHYGFIGLYIVRPDLRGRGIGNALLERALARAGARVIGLDAVIAQQPSYERRGFVLAHQNVRWRMAGGGFRPAGVVELSSVPLDDVLAFDEAVFGTERERFVRAWIDRPPGHALACVEGGVPAGYGVLRRCRAGAKVGPLFAEDAEVADRLLAGLLAAVPREMDVFVDMPEANPRTRALIAARHMQPVFETARMYRNGWPPEDLSRVFGVTTFEFG